MIRVNSTILGSVLALMTVGVQPSLLAGDTWRKEVQLADKVKAAPPSADRGEIARRLERLIDRKRSRIAPKELVDRLIDLMGDENGQVRAWVAVALGDLGPRATAAIPALEKAREEDEALLEKIGGVRTGIWVMDAVDVALKKVRGEKK
jgi:HEAT repeat protein